MFENKVVKNELERIRNINIIGTAEEGRDVSVDIKVLKEAIERIDVELVSGYENFAIVELNMWEECHKSFEKILTEFNLDVDDSRSDFDIYEWCIVKKRCERCEAEIKNEYHGIFGTLCKECDVLAFENQEKYYDVDMEMNK